MLPFMECRCVMKFAVNVFTCCGKVMLLGQLIKGLDMVAVNRSEAHEYRFDIKTSDRLVIRGVPVLAMNRGAALRQLRQIHPGCMVLADIAPTSEESQQIPRFLLRKF